MVPWVCDLGRIYCTSLHGVGDPYQEACAWHAGSEVWPETRKVPPPLLLLRIRLKGL